MIKTDELIKTIRNIVLDKYVVDDIDSTEVRNLRTGGYHKSRISKQTVDI